MLVISDVREDDSSAAVACVYREVAAAPTGRWPSSHGSSCRSAPATPPGRPSWAAPPYHWKYLHTAHTHITDIRHVQNVATCVLVCSCVKWHNNIKLVLLMKHVLIHVQHLYVHHACLGKKMWDTLGQIRAVFIDLSHDVYSFQECMKCSYLSAALTSIRKENIQKS